MNEILYCCSFRDLSRDPDVTDELLTATGWDFSSRLDAETGETMQTLYFPTAEAAAEAKESLERSRTEWRELGIEFGEVGIAELKKENWAESWKLHFKPMEISDRLALAPSWSGYRAKEGQHVVILDPGLSFGTGQHATTRFCLTRLDLLAKDGAGKLSLLDAGCGSGILAICAAKLGFGEISAFDIDPEAVEISRENAAENGVTGIRFDTAPLLEYSCGERKFDVVAANILSSALLAGREKILSLLKPGGTLILAGILDTEYPVVSKAFEEAGCRECASTADQGWRGGEFRFRA